MTGFLNSFLSGDKSAEEKTLANAQAAERQHDVLRLDMSDIEDEAEEESCATPTGCCGGGCRS